MIARNWRLRAVGGLCAAALTVGLAAVVTAPPAQAAFITSNAQRAVNYAVARGERAAVAVLDTETGSFYGAGSYNALMPTESVVKVFIATRLLLTGKMHGSVARTAYKMITQSDDASATALYGRVGGDGLVPWVARHYHLPSLGSGPIRSGWWGNTHVRAKALVQFYALVKKDRRVGPWLLNAMHHATRHGSDGQYQYFGIPAATSGFAIKQGWGDDDDCLCHSVFNSTGYIEGDRYAVAILTVGGSYGRYAMTTINGVARRLIFGRHISEQWHDSVLRLSVASQRGSAIHFVGYAYDHDRPSRRLSISIWDNGKLYKRITTTVLRTDVNSRHGLTGRHGFDIRFAVPNGKHTITLLAENPGAGTTLARRSHTFTINGNASGKLESAKLVGNDARLTGYAFDVDKPDSYNRVQIRDGGHSVGTWPANLPRPDVNTRFGLTGGHGFAITVPDLSAGAHTLCAWATNRGSPLAAPYVQIGCATLTVPPS